MLDSKVLISLLFVLYIVFSAVASQFCLPLNASFPPEIYFKIVLKSFFMQDFSKYQSAVTNSNVSIIFLVTFKNTPRTQRPSGCLAASEKE